MIKYNIDHYKYDTYESYCEQLGQYLREVRMLKDAVEKKKDNRLITANIDGEIKQTTISDFDRQQKFKGELYKLHMTINEVVNYEKGKIGFHTVKLNNYLSYLEIPVETRKQIFLVLNILHSEKIKKQQPGVLGDDYFKNKIQEEILKEKYKHITDNPKMWWRFYAEELACKK